MEEDRGFRVNCLCSIRWEGMVGRRMNMLISMCPGWRRSVHHSGSLRLCLRQKVYAIYDQIEEKINQNYFFNPSFVLNVIVPRLAMRFMGRHLAQTLGYIRRNFDIKVSLKP